MNLRSERGQELLLELVRRADVVTENFRPGTLERWNIGFEQMKEVNPKIILARISGYGQTGPYAERAGFASVAEAMGGLRYINGFPGEPPPRIHISLGDSLAGMFAAQGIVAALYWRDATGSGEGQVVDVSLLESSFALLESTVPEYDRLGIIRGPGGTGLKGVAPSNIFKSSDDKWVVIAANADNVFRRLCGAMGTPELADDERFATHLARGDNQEELEGIVREWASRHDAATIDTVLNDAGRHLWADLHDRGHLRGPAVQGAGHAPRARGSRVRALHRARGSSRSSPRRRARVRWSAPWEHGSHNKAVYGDLLGLSECGACRVARGRCDLSGVTICDVAARDGLQNDPLVLEPAVRAELVNRLGGAGLPCVEVVSFVSPSRVPQMAGAEEVVAALERRPGVVYAGLVLNERGYDRLAATGLGEVHFAFASTETLNERNQGVPVADSLAAAARIVERAHSDGIRMTVTIGAAFGCPFEGEVTPATVLGTRLAGRRRPARRDRPGGHHRREHARPGRTARSGDGCSRPSRGRPPPQHAEYRSRERVRGGGSGGRAARRFRRRHRRLSVRASRDRQHRDRGSRVHAAR